MMTTRNDWQAVGESMDEAVAGLTDFDADSLEALERRLGSLSAELAGRDFSEFPEMVPELLRKQTVLQEMLRATAANLKVMAAVREIRMRAHDGRTS